MYNLTGEAIQRHEVSSHVRLLEELFLNKCKFASLPLYDVDLVYGKELALLSGSSRIDAMVERSQKIRQAEKMLKIHGPAGHSVLQGRTFEDNKYLPKLVEYKQGLATTILQTLVRDGVLERVRQAWRLV